MDMRADDGLRFDGVGRFPDSHGSFALSALPAADRLRCVTAPLPSRFGGLGLGSDSLGGGGLAQLLLSAGEADLSLGRLVEGHVNAARLAFAHAPEALAQRIAADMRAGHALGIWNTEEPGTTLRAVHRDGALRLDGGKAFASGVGHLDRAVVTLFDPDGAWRLAYIGIPTDTSHDCWALPAMRGTATGSIDLSGIVIEPEAIFGAPDAYLDEPDFSAGAWRSSAVQAGALRGLIEAVSSHLDVAGQSAAETQLMRLATLIGHSRTAELWIEHCAAALDDVKTSAEAVALVNLTRSAVFDAAEASLSLARRMVGARAFLPGSPIERLLRDLDFYLRQPAPDQARIDAARFHLARRHGSGPDSLTA